MGTNMHEQSLIKSLLKQVDAIRREHCGGTVSQVRVEIGPLTGVEPLLLATAFEELAPAFITRGATLVIDEVDLVAECTSCNLDFEVQEFVFRCPTCDGSVRVIRGDEFQLVSVSLRTSDPAGEPIS